MTGNFPFMLSLVEAFIGFFSGIDLKARPHPVSDASGAVNRYPSTCFAGQSLDPSFDVG
jgi:hypothetical protein